MSDDLKETKVPIRGWLIFINILIWYLTIISIINLIGYFLSQPHFSNIIFFWGNQFNFIVQAILSIICLVFFTKRKRIFIKWFVGLSAWGIFYYIVYILFIIIFSVNGFITINNTNMRSYIAVVSNTLNIILGVAFILYALRSKRVKNTFVR